MSSNYSNTVKELFESMLNCTKVKSIGELYWFNKTVCNERYLYN